MSIKGSAESYVKLRGSLSMPEAIQGKSAYEIALMHGFKGTEEEWLKSLKGGEVPYVTEKDNGKFLRVVNGEWAAAEIETYEGEVI